LKSKEYKDINAINSAKIIDDLIHFTIARKFNISVFWELTNYLLDSQETNYSTWYPMIKMFEYISNVIPFTTTHIINSTLFAYIKHPISYTITVK